MPYWFASKFCACRPTLQSVPLRTIALGKILKSKMDTSSISPKVTFLESVTPSEPHLTNLSTKMAEAQEKYQPGERVEYKKPARRCPYCHETIAGGKLKRHLRRKHPKDFHRSVMECDSEKVAMRKIRNKGLKEVNTELFNKQHHQFESIHKCKGQIVHCESCDGAYARKYFSRHRKTCSGKAFAVGCFPELNISEGFSSLLTSFHADEIGAICRSDHTIRLIGKMLYDRDKSKVDKTADVKKSVMKSMRILAKLFVDFRKAGQDRCVLTSRDMFHRKNWQYLEEAVINITKKESGEEEPIKYGLKNTIYYLLKSAAELLQGDAIASTNCSEKTEKLINELKWFQVLLKHHEHTTFADAKYFINKTRQEKLRLPSRTPPDDVMQKLRRETLKAIREMSANLSRNIEKSDFICLRNAVCSRLTLFNARRGGEPCRLRVKHWKDRKQWLSQQHMTQLDEEELQWFEEFDIMYMTGKGNRLVSVLVPKDCIQALDLLSDELVRNQVGIDEKNSYLFASTRGSTGHTDGWHTLKYITDRSQITCNLINATNQRGRLSTLYAALDVAVEDRAHFYRHMGHSEKVNEGTYQRPLPIETVTKIGPVLQRLDNHLRRAEPVSRTKARKRSSDHGDEEAGWTTRKPNNAKPEDMDTDDEGVSTKRGAMVIDSSSDDPDDQVEGPNSMKTQKDKEERAKWSPKQSEELCKRFSEFIKLPSPKRNLPGRKVLESYIEEKRLPFSYLKVRTKVMNEQRKQQELCKKKLYFL